MQTWVEKAESGRTLPGHKTVPKYSSSFQDTPDTYNEKEVISLPIYTSSERDRIVARLDVPCGENQSQWLQCGAALFLKSQ